MKINKIIITLAFFTLVLSVKAQDYKITVDNSKDGKVSFENFMGDLPIEGYDGKDIIITSSSGPFVVPERAKGLKPVYSAGIDNTGIGLSVDKDGNNITVNCLLPITRRGTYKVKLPNNLALKYESGCERAGNISIQGMKNEVEIKTCQSITLKDVTGPVVLSTIGGNIDVLFSGPLFDKPCSISTVGGEIDVTLPAKANVDLELRSLSGTIYSDFEFQVADKKLKYGYNSSNLTQKLNGGGAGLSLVTVGGNIYLRKGK
jgi:hypothetical protein